MNESPSLPDTPTLPKVDATLAMPESLQKRTWRVFFVCLIIFIASMADLTTSDFRSKVEQTSDAVINKLPNTDVLHEWASPALKLADKAKDWLFNTVWHLVFDKDKENNF